MTNDDDKIANKKLQYDIEKQQKYHHQVKLIGITILKVAKYYHLTKVK